MAKNIVFLSGLPRTGSTLLTSILSQNPDIYVDGQSPLVFLMLGAKQTCNTLAKETLSRVHKEDFEHEWLTSIPDFYYHNVKQKIIIDKNRGWSYDSLQLRYYITPAPRILVMLRPITEIVKSFIRVNKDRGDILPERNLLSDNSPLLMSIQNVAWALANDSEDYLFGSYQQLVDEPLAFLERVSEFWGLPKYDYDFTKIKNPKPENDAMFNTLGLHEVRPQLGKQEYEVKISNHLMKTAQILDDALWNDIEQAKKFNLRRFI